MDKKKQYEAVKAFGEALHGLTEAGVKWVCDENGPKITIDFSDRNSGQHIAKYGKLDMTAGGRWRRLIHQKLRNFPSLQSILEKLQKKTKNKSQGR